MEIFLLKLKIILILIDKYQFIKNLFILLNHTSQNLLFSYIDHFILVFLDI